MMKKPSLLFWLVMCCWLHGIGQDSIQYRLLLIGDAGRINDAQQAVLKDALQQAIPGKTVVLYLGDNIYQKGIELNGAAREQSIAILQSQYEGFRKAGIPVYFIPGNHDWDNNGPAGYQKMRATTAFINHLQDSLVHIIPEDGCPGPYEMRINDNLVVVAMDSEWWLYPYNKHTDKSDCDCKTKRDVLGKLEDIVRRNSHRTIIFATHHPFASYGEHGGYFSFKQHLFPLTDLQDNLYLPLPVVGTLYTIARKTFPSYGDIDNVLYKDMKLSVNEILSKHPNVIHVAGHDHNLQLIQGAVLQVVSGGGADEARVKKGKGSLYAADSTGYSIADLLPDNSTRLQFRTTAAGKAIPSFAYQRAYAPPLADELFNETPLTGDSIQTPLITTFDSVSGFHRRMLGENYRNIWKIPTKLPILRLSATDLKPTEIGGGMQTHSLRLEDKDKKEWVFRSIDKFPDALLPQALSQTLASDLLHDNVSAIFPYAPMIVPVFSDALGVPHANPSLVYVAPDKKLGIYSRDFANKIMLFEEREPLGKSSSTLKMQEKLKDDNDNAIDQHAFLTARTQDIFIGDWDRHGDQWRWVDTDSGKDKKYIPVPRDRDQVFYVNEGLFPSILSLPWLMPKFQGFGSKIRNVNTFNFNARNIDGIFTNALSYDEWLQSTDRAVRLLNDSVIEAALSKLPPAVYAQAHDRLASQLKSRRQDLLRAMPQYFRFLSKDVDIIFSDKNEQLTITDT
ncbi:MAG TPA: metallophosphoesterase [Chitinophagaceae bacterium]|nr:metallophosphoesterase [Chitinophagaceae bacterium]